MPAHLFGRWKLLSLAQQYMLASFAVLIVATIGVGWWVDREIANGVVHRTGATTALYVDSFVSPLIQDLPEGGSLTPDQVAALSRLLKDTPLGRQIVAFKVWGRGGRVLFSTAPSETGQVFPVQGGLASAWHGEVASRISDLQDAENVDERAHFTHLLETYSPVSAPGSDQTVAVAEFYQLPDQLDREIADAQRRSWAGVALATILTYLLLAGIVRRGSDTIRHQQSDLREKVLSLTELLAQNQELHERVRRAARRTAELNEQFLRRISSELHDGPAQDLGLSLLRLDSLRTSIDNVSDRKDPRRQNGYVEELEIVQSSLVRALQDVRGISTGLRLPELENLTLAETVGRVVRAHERRTSSRVLADMECLPEQVGLPTKITVYRLIQEALSNAYRHGGGVEQQVRVSCDRRNVRVEISDRGPGFEWKGIPLGGQHLGLTSMRERVESLGGVLTVVTDSGKGTKVVATLPAQGEDPVETAGRDGDER